MKRRFIVEITVRDDVPGAPFDALMHLVEALDDMTEHKYIDDYGLALEHDFTWFVKTATDVLKTKELP